MDAAALLRRRRAQRRYTLHGQRDNLNSK